MQLNLLAVLLQFQNLHKMKENTIFFSKHFISNETTFQ